MPKLGLQLYTVRDAAEKDFLGTLRKVGQMGYEGVEFAGGIQQAATVQDLKQTLAETGLAAAGAIFILPELEKDLQGVISFCLEIGCPTVVFPWIDENLRQNEDGYRAMAGKFNRFGQRCIENGLQFLYHVHGYEFIRFDKKTGMELLMEELDPRVANLEIDVYWVEHAGVDSVQFMQEWGHRSPSIHFKDMKDRITKTDVEVGDGCIDIQTIARIGKANQAGWFIVEQEQFERPSLESAAISLANLRRIVQES